MLNQHTRLRTFDHLRNAYVSGVSYNPNIARTYLSGTSLLGHKKSIVDVISRHPVHILDAGTKNARFFREKSIRKNRLISDVKPVTIQQFKGFCSKGTLDTRGYIPANWTQFVLTGEFANCMGNQAPIPYSLIGGKYWSSLSTSPAVDADYVSWCIQKAWSECAAPDGELANALIELPQTLMLLISPMKAVTKVYQLLRRWTNDDAWVLVPKKGLLSLRTKRNFYPAKVTKSVLDEASSRWLELQYGLLPSIGDAEIVIAAVLKKLEPLREIMYGKSKFIAQNDRKVYSVEGSVEPAFNLTCKAEVTRKVTYTSKVYYRYKDVPSLGMRLGFGPSNFANVLWEATPWSFVVDWLWNIGDFLNRVANYDRISIASNYVSIKYDQKLVGHVMGASYNGYGLKPPSSKLYYHQEELVRLVNQPLPYLPQFNVKWFNITRSLNALSLIWQNLPK